MHWTQIYLNGERKKEWKKALPLEGVDMMMKCDIIYALNFHWRPIVIQV